jgi:glucosamine-phosphate N-acetyltransferase
VEDVVIDKSCRGKNLGKLLVDSLVSLARELSCYKVILNCNEKNVPFYTKVILEIILE